MRMLMFVFNVSPTAAITNAGDIGGALAHVWVDSTDDREAEIAARGFVMAQGWLIGELEHAFAPTPEQIAQLDDIESANYQRAVREGIHAYYIGWPKKERPEDSPVEGRRLVDLPAPARKQ